MGMHKVILHNYSMGSPLKKNIIGWDFVLKKEKPESMQFQMKKSSPPKQQVLKNKPKKSNELHKGRKKQKPRITWPHLKLLGC
ncbi:hypothetical protein Lal_00025927 [Lupinus albus]|nr:hypothetical protein Lal_00025927 [Lupinus albus]